MKIKNWVLYLESSVKDSEEMSSVRDAFTNLSDEYEIIIKDKGDGVYYIFIETGFDLSLTSKLFLNKEDMSLYRDRLDKLKELNLLIDEAVSRFDIIKWRVSFGGEMSRNNPVFYDSEYYRMMEEGTLPQLALVSIDIREKTLVNGELCHLDGNTLIVNLEQMEKLIIKNGYKLQGEIFKYDETEIRFRVTDNEWYNKEDAKRSNSLLTALKNGLRPVVDTIPFTGDYFRLEIKPKYKIIFE